ncbi:hypothetical protein [Streptomyces sp. CoH17]|uniref:hypothetical protein n=1 Tax=Streptomyces sp. CoH17 TaxID=2992806 RepID=UPI0022718838|nr:hypothetical protein [Streptomyces sp. CoH17]
MARTASAKNSDALGDLNLVDQFKTALKREKPFDSIVDFATHRSFCGKRLYPRQKTLLKLMYLETENMTSYDIDVIDSWRTTFGKKKEPFGVQEDIWDRVAYLKERGYTHFPHIQAVQGRRASKGVMGGILGAERMLNMLSKDDPQAFYGVEPGKDLYLYVVATNSLQAKRFLFADIRATVESCKFFDKYISTSKEYYLSLRTPADLRRIADLKVRNVPIDREIATIRALAMSSTSASGRGGTGFANFFDEFAHMITGTGGPRTSEEVYEAYQPSLDQFGKDALTYIPSSPYTKVGKFFDLYTSGRVLLQEFLEKQGKLVTKKEEDDLADEIEGAASDLMADPEMLVIQLPSWDLYKDFDRSHQLGGPKITKAIQYEPLANGKPENERMIRLENRDPAKFKVERRAQFAEVLDAYLDPEKVDQIFEPFWGGRTLEQTDRGIMKFVYHGHVDPSKTNANFAFAVGHLEQAPEPDEYGYLWPHVIFDKLHVYKPGDYADHTVDYVGIGEDLDDLLHWFPTMERFSFDQWNSQGFIASLKKKYGQRTRVNLANFSHKRNQDVAEKFKAAINLGWVHAYKDTFFNDGEGSLLEQELKFLQEVNGKVQKQSVGPVTTKDLADCVMEVTVRLLAEALEKWQKELLSNLTPGVGLQSGYPNRHTEMEPRGAIPTTMASRETVRDVLNRNRDASRGRGVPSPFTNRLRGGR